MSSDEETAAKKARREFPKHAPMVCYKVEDLPYIDKDRYATLAKECAAGKYELVKTVEIPPCDGRATEVKAGQLFRVVCTHGPQVADVNFWNAHNPKERFYTSKTRQLHASHLTTFDRLWSNMPYLRPLATITHDTISYGYDEDNASVHDCIGSRCDPYTNKLLSGVDMTTCCHSNLTRAAKSVGLEEEDVHDVLNVFMCTGFTPRGGKYFAKPSPVQKGDYLEFLAEIDLIVGLSTCPQGDVSIACGTNEAPKCYPLAIEVYQPTPEAMEEWWKASEPVKYLANHGL